MLVFLFFYLSFLIPQPHHLQTNQDWARYVAYSGAYHDTSQSVQDMEKLWSVAKRPKPLERLASPNVNRYATNCIAWKSLMPGEPLMHMYHQMHFDTFFLTCQPQTIRTFGTFARQEGMFGFRNRDGPAKSTAADQKEVKSGIRRSRALKRYESESDEGVPDGEEVEDTIVDFASFIDWTNATKIYIDPAKTKLVRKREKVASRLK